MQPVVLQNHIGSHLVDLFTYVATEVLLEIGSVNFIIFNFGAVSNHCMWIIQIVESTLLAEYVSLLESS